MVEMEPHLAQESNQPFRCRPECLRLVKAQALAWISLQEASVTFLAPLSEFWAYYDQCRLLDVD